MIRYSTEVIAHVERHGYLYSPAVFVNGVLLVAGIDIPAARWHDMGPRPAVKITEILKTFFLPKQFDLFPHQSEVKEHFEGFDFNEEEDDDVFYEDDAMVPAEGEE